MQLQMALHEGLRNKDYLVKWSVIFKKNESIYTFVTTNVCLWSFEAALKLQFWPSTRWSPLSSPLYREKSLNVLLKTLNILDNMEFSKLSENDMIWNELIL